MIQQATAGSRQGAALAKKVNIPEFGIITKREFMERAKAAGWHVESKEMNGYQDGRFNRRTFNRLAGDEQTEYENRMKQTKICYSLYVKGTRESYDISKAEFDFFNSLASNDAPWEKVPYFPGPYELKSNGDMSTVIKSPEFGDDEIGIVWNTHCLEYDIAQRARHTANLFQAAPEMLEVLQTNSARAEELIRQLRTGNIEDPAREFRNFLIAFGADAQEAIKLATEGRK